MADEHEPRDDYPHDVDDRADPADLAFAADELARLTFLRPDDATVEPMPEWAWDRVAGVLAQESARRSTAGSAAMSATARSGGGSRLLRWGGGLAAASLAVVAIGAAVTLSGGSDGDLVAADAPAASLLTEAEPDVAGATLDAQVLEAPEALSVAGMVPPAQMLVDSKMNYTADALRSQVTSVLRRFGVDERAKAADAEAPLVIETANLPTTGFTASEQALRDCITTLTRFAGSTALMVDRSDFEGKDAGVVVAPTYETTSPAPDMTRLQVWVVDPDCRITMGIQISMKP